MGTNRYDFSVSRKQMIIISHIRQIIKSYTKKIRTSIPEAPRGPCLRCSARNSRFKLHEKRFRFLRFIENGFVCKLQTLLLVWKCLVCRKTFTQYPCFCLPYKRYAKQVVEGLCTNYLSFNSPIQQSYRKAVSTDNHPLYYHQDSSLPNDQALSHTTLYNWITFLGSEDGPESTTVSQSPPCHCSVAQPPGNAAVIPPIKYRSLTRLAILKKAWYHLTRTIWNKEEVCPG